MKCAVIWAVVLGSLVFLACCSTSEQRKEPAELRFGIVWKEGEPLEGRTGPFRRFNADVGGSDELYLGAETLTARPARVTQSADHTGFPAVSFTLTPEDSVKFEAFTGRHVDQLMAILVDGVVVSLATIAEPLPGSAQIAGRFTQAQVDELIAKLTR